MVLDAATLKTPKTAALRAQFDKLGLKSALVIAGPEVDGAFRLAARNIPGVDVLPNAGLNVYDVLRRDTLVLTRAAVEGIEARFAERERRLMPTVRHYDTVLAPVITEKATLLSEQNKVVFKVAMHATKDEIAEAVEQLFKVNVTKVNTLIVKGKTKTLPRPQGPPLGRQEGRRDAGRLASRSTSRRGSKRWRSRPSIRPRHRRRGLVLVDRSDLHKGKPEKSLIEGLTKSGGRGGDGRIAVRFRGGGAKRLYRKVDFKRRKWGVAGHRRAARVRPEPHRLHRPDQVRGRRTGLHPGAATPDASATR